MGSEQWGVGPAIRLPIFDAGRLRANLRGKTADLDAAIESYNGAVLEACTTSPMRSPALQSITRQQAEQREARSRRRRRLRDRRAALPRRPGHLPERAAAETAVLNQRRLASTSPPARSTRASPSTAPSAAAISADTHRGRPLNNRRNEDTMSEQQPAPAPRRPAIPSAARP
jgi:hypothetical protein